MIRRRTFLTTIGAAVFCAGAAPAVAQSLTTMRVGMAVTDAVTPVLYGIQSGMFKDAGLDVQVVTGTSGAALAAAVVGGSLEIGTSSLMPLLSGYLRGVQLPIIAGSTIYAAEAPTSEVCVLKSSRFKSLADMNGTTFATQAVRSLDEIGIRGLIDKNHGNSATLKFIETPYTLMVGALERGQVDGTSISQPNLTLALDSGKLRTLGATYGGVGDRLLIAAYFCSQTYLAQNRAAIGRFTVALYRATQYTNTHHAETVSLIADWAHMDPELVKRMTRATNATSLDPRQIQIGIDMAAKYKYIDRSFNAKELLG